MIPGGSGSLHFHVNFEFSKCYSKAIDSLDSLSSSLCNHLDSSLRFTIPQKLSNRTVSVP